ncbi:MAG: hypothetical protein JNN15_20085, partial [Blastocatellia bacterium]|nr:hypothetical protein [Blastocatellia bacterium]
VTPLRGWLTGTVGTWQTEDGGFTWNKLFPEDCISVEFTTSGYGLLSTAERSGYTKIFISKDFGGHWQESSLKVGQYKVNKLESLLAIDQTYLAVMHLEQTKGEKSTVFVRSNNGINWEILSSSLNANGSYKLFFINQKEGWIADRFSATIFQTIDGGKSWSQLSTKPPIETLISFFFVDLQKGWLISEPDSTEETGVYRTEDGGASWTVLTSEELERFEITEWKDLMLLKMLLNHKK